MENERLYQILLYCLNEDSIVAQHVLAQEFRVSKSTIRSEIDKLEKLVEKWDLELIKKRGAGIRIEGSKAAKIKVQNMIRDLFQKESLYKNDELDYGILLYLFQNFNHYVRIFDLANEFYVSESVISKRLKHLKETLIDSQIQLKAIQNKGIKIIGSEEKIRVFFARLMAKRRECATHKAEPIRVQEQIMQMLNIESESIFRAIQVCEKELNKSFSDEARNALAIHIAIAIKRSYQGKSVPCHRFIDRKAYEKEYIAATHLFEYIMKHYGITFDEDEIYYLFLHIISAKVIEDKELTALLDTGTQEEIKNIAAEITMLVNNIKQIHVKQTHIDNLILHLRPMINRLEYGIELENPLLNDIKNNYPEAYGIAWMCNTILRNHLGKELSENEAGFIAMHIQAMIESNKRNIRVVIVCSSGIGVSQLLSTQVEQYFSRIHIVAVESLSSFYSNQHGKDIDLILSTFPIKCEQPLLIVSPLLTNEDIHAIQMFVNSHQVEESSKKRHLGIRTFLKMDWKTQDEVIQNIGKKLLAYKEVTENFIQGVYEREKLNSTAIGMQVALPHAPFDTICKTQIVVVTLKNEIIWGEDYVDFIMFTLVCETDVSWANVALKAVYRKLYSATFHKELLKITDEQEMIQKLI